MAQIQPDPNFVKFVDMVYGIRAALVLLRRYIKSYKSNTIEKITHRWCPDFTAPAYAKSVSEYMGIPKEQVLTYEDKPLMITLVKAMSKVENGADYLKDSVIEQAYEMTL